MHRPQQADKKTRNPIDKIAEMATIKSKLLVAGLTLLEIDRTYQLPRGTAGTTLREPNIGGERAIAAALGTKPHLLWRSRYHGSGLRKSPQPRENYERPATMAQRQNGVAA
jgi:Ner family transcriptional regulator